MPQIVTAIGTDATNSFVDLSGITYPPSMKKRRQQQQQSWYTNSRNGTVSSLAYNSNYSNSSSYASSLSGSSEEDVVDAEGRAGGRLVLGLRGGEGGDGEELEGGEDAYGYMTEEEEMNPYNVLIEVCDHDLTKIQSAYSTHRTARNALSRNTLLSPTFSGPITDPLLSAIIAASPPAHLLETDDLDPRHCLTFCTRPSDEIKLLVEEIQRRLSDSLTGIPGKKLWTMPKERLHLTVLEVIHSTTQEAVEELVGKLAHGGKDEPDEREDKEGLKKFVQLPKGKGVRLGKPYLSYDKAALAVSFLPLKPAPRANDDGSSECYTYHHLRRDLYSLVGRTGVEIDSRYVVPSAHITVARFIDITTSTQTVDSASVIPIPELMDKWISAIDGINDWLTTQSEEFLQSRTGGKWEGWWEIEGLECGKGRLWYGGGELVMKG